MDILGKLFSSVPLVKILRLFLMNPETGFELKEIAKRGQMREVTARTEINLLKSIGFVKKRVFYKEVKNKQKELVKKKTSGWFLDQTFTYLRPLFDLLIGNQNIDKKDILQRLRRSGKLKMIIVSGAFIRNYDSRLDLLVVGDHVNNKRFENIVKTIESEVGTELKYALFTTEEFKYRVNMYDKLVCDVFEFDHEVILSAPDLSTDRLKNRK